MTSVGTTVSHGLGRSYLVNSNGDKVSSSPGWRRQGTCDCGWVGPVRAHTDEEGERVVNFGAPGSFAFDFFIHLAESGDAGWLIHEAKRLAQEQAI